MYQLPRDRWCPTPGCTTECPRTPISWVWANVCDATGLICGSEIHREPSQELRCRRLRCPFRVCSIRIWEHQFQAVWHVLNQPNFRPPTTQSDSPSCVVAGIAVWRNALSFLTDVLQSQERLLIKPFLVALPNRHNVVFDLESGATVQLVDGRRGLPKNARQVVVLGVGRDDDLDER